MDFEAHKHIEIVSSFQALVDTQYTQASNAVCWERKLEGDFSEIINQLEQQENITELSERQLLALQLSEQGAKARNILLTDFNLLQAHGASPSLNLIRHYEKDDFFFPTDVYSFHVDRSPIPTDTFLCTYHGEASEILPNAQAIQKILIPEIRDELKRLYGGNDSGFDAFLTEHFFDLHYQATTDARPISLGIGNMWKLAVDFPDSHALPCLHRAPKEKDGEPRLLLIC